MDTEFSNPFRPGAGHSPPYLAGRIEETEEFIRLLQQETILENLILTGLRGVGKTVLLDSFKPKALKEKWLWVGTDLSESSSINEERIALRLLTDLAVVTAGLQVAEQKISSLGFGTKQKKVPITLDFNTLQNIYRATPGLPSDKLKQVLELVWSAFHNRDEKGLIFAYDESQNLSDHAEADEYPTSLLLDVFQSIQRKGIPFILVLVGLPTLFPKLVEARTYSERMFRVLFLDSLSDEDSKDAILKPIEDTRCPVKLNKDSTTLIIRQSGGYPYFIQFICREVYDAFLRGQESVPVEEITLKLDSDFFAGRWARATDRQRELLTVIASLDKANIEFSVQEIAEKSKELPIKNFSSSNVSQMLTTLINLGLIYKNRHGKYSFAVPLLHRFISRQNIASDEYKT